MARGKSEPSVSSDEARRICVARLSEFKALPYADLARHCDHKLACEVLGENEVKYAHETYTFYDGKPGGDIRVLVEVWAFDPTRRDWTGRLAGGGLLAPREGSPSQEWQD